MSRPCVNVTFSGSEVDFRKVLTALNLLLRVGDSTMTAISDFAELQRAFNQRMDDAIQGISDDIAQQSELIARLQASPSVSPEDQDVLTELTQRSESLAGRLEAVDRMHPPTPPVEVPTPGQ